MSSNPNDIPLGELYGAFMGACPDEHDALYGLFRRLLSRQNPAVLLTAIEGAMADELNSSASQCDRNKVAQYRAVLRDAINMAYREIG